MRILRGAERSYQLAARPTLTPSKWLMRFVKVDNEDLYQLCIADAITTAGVPVLLTFTEVPTGADPLDAEVTLPPGQWQMYVYEQDSTTNLNWTLADRFVHEVMVEVVGAATADPDPTDPCDGVVDCDPVSITDQDDNEIASVDSGGTYQVFVLDSVNDETPYETAVIINDN